MLLLKNQSLKSLLKAGVLSFGLVGVAMVQAAAPVVDGQDARTVQTTTQSSQQNRLIAELVLQVNQLQQEVSQLRGQLEEQDYKLQQMNKQQRELYLDLDRRLQNGVVAGTNTGGGAGSQTVTSVDTGEVQTAYNKAFTQYKDKQYAFAKDSFKTFLMQFPKEPLASNAHFWLGQLHLKDKEYDSAETQFKSVYEKFPQANKTDVALLKLGQLEELRKNIAAAKGYYQKAATDYPNSTAGKLAKAKLESL